MGEGGTMLTISRSLAEDLSSVQKCNGRNSCLDARDRCLSKVVVVSLGA